MRKKKQQLDDDERTVDEFRPSISSSVWFLLYEQSKWKDERTNFTVEVRT